MRIQTRTSSRLLPILLLVVLAPMAAPPVAEAGQKGVAEAEPQGRQETALEPDRRGRAAGPGAWRIELELGAETALNEAGFDLNQHDTAQLGLAIDGLGARHRVRGRLDVSRRLTGDFGLLAGVEVLSMHGEHLPGRVSSHGLDPVARVFVYRYGFVLPAGLRLYVESQDHWGFADHPELIIDGPYEIYNMVMLGRELSWDLGRRGRWGVDGRCELGVNWPRNEFGVNLRRPGEEATDGFGDNYGRYALRCRELGVGRRLEGDLVEEVRLYANLFLALGRTIPQQLYTWSPRYIGHQRNVGIQARLADDWTVFMERQWRWALADDQAEPGEGPFGAYLSVGFRKHFDWRF